MLRSGGKGKSLPRLMWRGHGEGMGGVGVSLFLYVAAAVVLTLPLSLSPPLSPLWLSLSLAVSLAASRPLERYWFMLGSFGFFSTSSLAAAPHVVVRGRVLVGL